MECQPHGPPTIGWQGWSAHGALLRPTSGPGKKVNHDTHKELGPQEHVVLQYACTLQYISFCNDARYKDHLAPAVKDFWAEVVEPFGSRALCNLDPSHLLGDAMHPNRGAKIPDYGVWDHIAHVCAPFFQGVESQSQYKNR